MLNAADVIGSTLMVGLYPQGESPFGVQDMAGNVREWVSEWYDDAETKKMLKGGSFSDTYEHVRISDRLGHIPTSPGHNRGFRCVYPMEP